MSSQRSGSLVPDWIVAVAALVTVLLFGFNLAYQLGATGIRVAGSSMSFDRQFDDTVYRLSDNYGFEVDEYSVRVVEVRRGRVPINPVCGRWDARAIVMANPSFVQDGVVLADEYYEWETPGGIDLESGEFLSVEELAARGLPAPRLWTDPSRNPSGSIPSAATPDADKPDGDHPAIPPKPPRESGAVAGQAAPIAPSAAPREPLTRERIVAEHDSLRVINESCIVFNVAFVVIYALLALIALPVAVTRLVRRRRTA